MTKGRKEDGGRRRKERRRKGRGKEERGKEEAIRNKENEGERRREQKSS